MFQPVTLEITVPETEDSLKVAYNVMHSCAQALVGLYGHQVKVKKLHAHPKIPHLAWVLDTKKAQLKREDSPQHQMSSTWSAIIYFCVTFRAKWLFLRRLQSVRLETLETLETSHRNKLLHFMWSSSDVVDYFLFLESQSRQHKMYV